MTTRERLSASVEADLLAAGRAAVAEGRAESLSAWVNEALRRQTAHDERLRALDDLLGAYEAEHGVITAEEMDAASRRARGRAVIVRASPPVGRGDQHGAA
ncbi:MAG: hypothetical protein AB7W59_03855 [Acidimicrobiia bacterium]